MTGLTPPEEKTIQSLDAAVGTATLPEPEQFTPSPLTPLERAELGLEPYYSPFRVSRKGDASAYLIGKRIFDIFFAALFFVAFSPLILVVMLAIRIEDPKGSAIFKQQRIGKDGKPFTFYKLRSMCTDAEDRLESLLEQNEFDGKAFKIKRDPRITKVGRFIRSTSIDELPQLINVLRGDMSLVGPRPPLPREVEQYDDYELQRLSVTPGLTCFWQAYPHRHEVSFEDWVALDMKYIEERSWKTDLRLIGKTILLLLRGSGD